MEIIIISLVFTILILVFSWWQHVKHWKKEFHAEEERFNLATTRLENKASYWKNKFHEKISLEAEVRSNKASEQKPPSNFNRLPPIIFYTDDYWQELSVWYRQEQNWTCEGCGIDLREHRYFLHTHHIHGTRWNDPKYLKALCIACHAEQPGGNHHLLRQRPTYKRFMKIYGKQWQTVQKMKILCS